MTTTKTRKLRDRIATLDRAIADAPEHSIVRSALQYWRDDTQTELDERIAAARAEHERMNAPGMVKASKAPSPWARSLQKEHQDGEPATWASAEPLAVGDTVAYDALGIVGTVKSIIGESVQITMSSGGCAVCYRGTLRLVRRGTALAVGDTVGYAGDPLGALGTILAIDGDMLWVKKGPGHWFTTSRKGLERVS